MSQVSTQRESPVSNPITNDLHWKQEFEELDRRFQGMSTEAEAKEIAKQELAKHNDVIKPIETELAKVRAVLTDPSAAFLSLRDKKDIQEKVESLEYQLEQAKKARERSIRLNGACIRDAKEWAPKRERWLELRKRAHDIERAKNIASGKGGQDDLAVGFPRKW